MRARTLLGAFAAAATIVIACGEQRVYVYTAQKWNATDRCLDDYTPVETVEGDGADSTCPAACLAVGGDLYVSTVCPPLPANATAVAATDPECRDALAAAAQKRACGSSPAPADASEEAETGTDAGEDTSVGTDAADGGGDADADAADAQDG